MNLNKGGYIMNDPRVDYDEWRKRIAESKDAYALIDHFRKHVSEHFERYNRKEKISLDIWVIGVLNFMHILEKKFPHITSEDMLFKLCAYYKIHDEGCEPPFDIEEFLKSYNGTIKTFIKFNGGHTI